MVFDNILQIYNLYKMSIHISEGGYGINTQVEKSKDMTIVKFMKCDLNQLFWIFVDSWKWQIRQSVHNIAFNVNNIV